jgi:hypothetical protein
LDRSRPHIHRAIEMAKKVVAQGNEDEIEGMFTIYYLSS